MNNNNLIDENVVRTIAVQVVLLVVLAIYFQWNLVMLFLTLDFTLRAFTNKVSPLAFVSKNLVKLFKLKPKYIFSGPKKFAAGLGAFFSLSILLLLVAELYFLAWVVGFTLIFCAFLEAALKICVGCYVYSWFVAPIINHRNKLKAR